MKKVTFILLLACMLFGLACCASANEPASEKSSKQQLFAMDTVIDITAYGENADKAAAKANQELTRLERLLSVTKQESDVYKINHSGGKSVKVSEDTAQIIAEALKISGRTNGIFDISVYPLVKAWGFTTQQYKVPKDSQIRTLLNNVGFQKIKFDQKEKTVTIEENMALDLGAIAKGYAAKKLSGVMKENGVTNAVLSLGGNVQTIGSKPDGTNWTVAVEYPDTKEHFATLQVGECSVITSGAYQRYFEKDGKRYHHIIDPRTGKPSESGLKSATAVCGDPTQGDALSTSLFIMGAQQAQAYYRQYGGFDYVLLTDQDEVYITQGIKEQFALTSKYHNLKVHIVTP